MLFRRFVVCGVATPAGESAQKERNGFMDQHLTASRKMGETENGSGATGKSGNDLKMLCKGDLRYAI
jgi:hypothetical protein